MAGQVWLRSVAKGVTLTLPVWPQDSTEVMSAWSVSSLDRVGDVPLDVPTYLTTGERSLGFTLRHEDYRQSVSDLLATLRDIAARKSPVQLVMGDTDTGLWRMDAPQITELERAADGSPSVADVSLVLKRATSAQINVGPVKKIKGGGSGFARRG